MFGLWPPIQGVMTVAEEPIIGYLCVRFMANIWTSDCGSIRSCSRRSVFPVLATVQKGRATGVMKGGRDKTLSVQ